MNSAIGTVVVLFILGVLFFLTGHCFCGVFHRKERPSFQLLVGAVVFFAVFSLIELPAEKLKLPFHMLVISRSLPLLRRCSFGAFAFAGRKGCLEKKGNGYR